MIEEKQKKPQVKVCRQCKVEKASSEFYPKRYRNVSGEVRSYLNSICKTCFAAGTKTWESKNPDKRRAITRNYRRKKMFGIDSAEYLRMNERQNFACAICGSADGKRRLDIDHCHSSGRIRELLCTNCNNGLGRFQDSADLLRKAADYIEKHSEKKDVIIASSGPNFGEWVAQNVSIKSFTAVM